MIKTRIVLIIFVLFLLLSGCSDPGGQKSGNSTIGQAQSTKVSSSPLDNEDFAIEYDGLRLKLGDSPDQMLQELFNTDSNGLSPGESKSFQHPTEGGPLIDVTVKLDEEGRKSITRIEASDGITSRGIEAGHSSANDIVSLYGTPDKTEQKNGTFAAYTYQMGNQKLLFYCYRQTDQVFLIVIEGNV